MIKEYLLDIFVGIPIVIITIVILIYIGYMIDTRKARHKKRCPKCGTKSDKLWWNYCPNCGAELKERNK